MNVTNRSVIRSGCNFVEILSKVNRSNYLSLFAVYQAVFFWGGLAGLGDSHVNATRMLDGQSGQIRSQIKYPDITTPEAK